eukprot:8677939-Pyramimonas_sp.AAC.2
MHAHCPVPEDMVLQMSTSCEPRLVGPDQSTGTALTYGSFKRTMLKVYPLFLSHFPRHSCADMRSPYTTGAFLPHGRVRGVFHRGEEDRGVDGELSASDWAAYQGKQGGVRGRGD